MINGGGVLQAAGAAYPKVLRQERRQLTANEGGFMY